LTANRCADCYGCAKERLGEDGRRRAEAAVVEDRGDKCLVADLNAIDGVGDWLGTNEVAGVLRHGHFRTWWYHARSMNTRERGGILRNSDLTQTRDRWEKHERDDHRHGARAEDQKRASH
jgi:hypothetical protein